MAQVENKFYSALRCFLVATHESVRLSKWRAVSSVALGSYKFKILPIHYVNCILKKYVIWYSQEDYDKNGSEIDDQQEAQLESKGEEDGHRKLICVVAQYM